VRRSIVSLFLAATLLITTSGAAWAIEPPPERGPAPVWQQIIDVVFVRPVSFVAATAATGVAIGLMPLAAPALLADDLWNEVIVDSWAFTFKRPLGFQPWEADPP
jgi:hypothetical protein